MYYKIGIFELVVVARVTCPPERFAQKPSASGIAHGVGMSPALLVGVPPCHRRWYGSKPLTTMVHWESNLVLQKGLFLDPQSIVELWYIRVVVARTGASVVRIKGFLAISKCAFARALLAHFAVFATCALPKVASIAGRKTGVLHPTCDLQFLRWNHTHSFCRTFLWRGIARRGSSILHRSGVLLKVQSITKAVIF
jgi:hypothetical protein